jgi:hypothetical protein
MGLIDIYSGCIDKAEEFKEAVARDPVLNSLYKDIVGKISDRKINITSQIRKRRLVLAKAAGLAVEAAAGMVCNDECGGDFQLNSKRLKGNFGEEIEVYENKKNPDEKYTYCSICKVYIRGKLPFEKFDETSLISKSKGIRYICPICKNEIGRLEV